MSPFFDKCEFSASTKCVQQQGAKGQFLQISRHEMNGGDSVDQLEELEGQCSKLLIHIKNTCALKGLASEWRDLAQAIQQQSRRLRFRQALFLYLL